MDVRSSGPQLTIFGDSLELQSRERTQFVDLTEWVAETLERSGVVHGLAQIQVLHTTAAIMVNENEPRLLEDFKTLLERLAPGNGVYAHDDMEQRRAHALPEERPNGHAHARALLVGPSKILNVREGRVALGRWQSVFLVELDGPRTRTISLTVMGHGSTA